MKTYFGLVIAALGVAVLSGGALLWDGSYYLYATLDTQTPFLPNHRYIAVVLETPVLEAYHFTHNMYVLKLVFGLTYAMIPLLSLAVSWLIVRRTAPALFVWAALGFGFGTLMLQLFFVAEATISVQLMWPVILAVITRPRWWTRVAVGLLSLIAFFTHPFALALFAVAAGLAVVVGIRYRAERLEKWLWAFGFVILGAVGVHRFASLQTNYETDQISLQILQLHYQQALQGLPILAFGAVGLAIALLFAAPYLQGRQKLWQQRWAQADLTMLLYTAELASLLAAGALFATWAVVPRLWAGALDYRTWVLFFSLPFMGMAGLESLLSRSEHGQGPGTQLNHRTRTVQVVGLVFATVIVLQSLSWHNVTNQLREAMAESLQPCIPIKALTNVPHTALAYWSLTPYSLLLQSTMPDKFVLNGDCEKTDFKKGLPIAVWDLRQWTVGEFDLHLLHQSLAAAS
jgi:hypothetical protein